MSDVEVKKSSKKKKEKEKKHKKEKKASKKRKKDVNEGANNNEDEPNLKRKKGEADSNTDSSGFKKVKKLKKEKKSSKKIKKDANGESKVKTLAPLKDRSEVNKSNTMERRTPFNFPVQYILAPMVGASELPFRILCRKYGAQTCYTPMMSSTKFATDPKYRAEEFQTIKEDRPLVCHFSANDPTEFTEAAKLVQDRCDAIDLNLGCPQRTAYLGHFGSYLLEPKDRNLICSIVKKASGEVSVPIFCKIRLLNTIEETIKLCQELKDAGASLIAIHARYRASFERKGAGARDGPAFLDQILKVREALGKDFPLIANGNVITYDDVENNMRFTKANGVMSAEGILDNPALFLPRYGEDGEVEIADPSPLHSPGVSPGVVVDQKLKRKLSKKLREIESLEAKLASNKITNLSDEQKEKLSKKETIIKSLAKLEHSTGSSKSSVQSEEVDAPRMKLVKVKKLKEVEADATRLALEYLDLAEKYPTKMRTVIFHTRRILKKELNNYQLMADCIGSKSVQDLRNLISTISKYIKDPSSFAFDKEKAKKEKEAAERKKREEGKRKAYEARMVRKAKREGLKDLEYYLRQGAKVPTAIFIDSIKNLSKKDQMKMWSENDHSQHCLAFHLDPGGCKRDRACAFLHADAKGENAFAEMDEVAG